MKIEDANVTPVAAGLRSPETRPQSHAQEVTHILLDGQGWMPIVKGSFHFYKTPGDKPVPFVTFDIDDNPIMGELAGHRCEVFPTAVAGFAYPTPE